VDYSAACLVLYIATTATKVGILLVDSKEDRPTSGTKKKSPFDPILHLWFPRFFKKNKNKIE